MKAEPKLKTTNRIKEQIVFWAMASLIGLLTYFGAFNTLQYWAEDKRAGLVSIPASEQFVFVGIDTKSIQEFGIWPWPRSIHASVIEMLNKFGAEAIAIDIDFSTLSDPEQDIGLAMAMGNVEGNLVLPMFVQDRSANHEDDALALSAPHQIFTQNSKLATVNVIADDDGTVRRFPFGMNINERFFPSFPAIISGADAESVDNININFSIDPKTIPSHSVSDLLAGHISPSSIAGKTVIYGAQAVELRDNFTTPVHGTLPGSVVQILAAETLYQGLNINVIEEFWPFLLGCAFIAILSIVVAGQKLVIRIVSFISLACIFEAIGLYLYAQYSVVLHTAPLVALAFLTACLAALFEVGVQHVRALFERTGKQNAEQLLNQVVEDNVCGIIVIDQNGHELTRNTMAKAFLSDFQNQLPDELQKDVERCFNEDLTQGVAAECKGEITFEKTDQNNVILEYVISRSALKDLEHMQSRSSSDKIVVCITLWDVTEKRAQQQKIAYLAEHDELTGTLRREAFEEAIKGHYDCTIFAINLHRFKTINLTLGRNVGDQLLCLAVERILALDPNIGHISRLAGDVFAIAYNSYFIPEVASDKCQQIINELETPFEIDRAAIHIGAHVGCAVRLYDTDHKALLSQAEFALDEARKVQGSNYFIHEIALSEQHSLLRRIENDMWSALENNEFRLVYQPQVNLDTEQLCGAEALVRWDHPTLGFISPADFIDMAEANGFIDKLGAWVMKQACIDALTLPHHITIAVNVSPAQIMRCNVPEMVRDALFETGLPATRLHIEITEIGILETHDQVISDLYELREMGICVALDDFGTGVSSLSYFTNFPINKIKLDQMFVRTLQQGDKNEAIIRSVKSLSDGLNLIMICEGVETKEQAELLASMDIDQAQGYYYGRPMDIKELNACADAGERLRA